MYEPENVQWLQDVYCCTFPAYLPFPVFNRLERHSIGGAECQHACLGATIISFGDCIELFLTSCIPQHYSYVLAVDSVEPELEKNMVFRFVLLRDYYKCSIMIDCSHTYYTTWSGKGRRGKKCTGIGTIIINWINLKKNYSICLSKKSTPIVFL